MSSGHRSSGYTNEEDTHLCHVYLDVSQNPIIDIPKFSNDTSPPQLSQRRMVDICSSQSDTPSTESPTSPNLTSSTFSLHLIDGLILMIAAQIEARKWAVKELWEEQKIFQKDLSSEPDPTVREYYQTERTRILTKKAQQGQ
ncbi:hypothetical protein Ddye_003438 [Dipteronia dyeriana]|uniref:Uncharacterized protein n=1 Tax=Dipteronia dyeriana TaxID=168575 RepID=A0AAD9XSA5_9ROSI|nr:hypothetical protein Ddye_003438 [Dipteronia dyeriana]